MRIIEGLSKTDVALAFVIFDIQNVALLLFRFLNISCLGNSVWKFTLLSANRLSEYGLGCEDSVLESGRDSKVISCRC